MPKEDQEGDHTEQSVEEYFGIVGKPEEMCLVKF